MVVHSKVCCVRLEFVTAAARWSKWWTGVQSVGKADLLLDHYDSKQSRESVDLLLTCHLSPSLTYFAFRSSEVRRLLLDLDPYGGSDPLGMFLLFLKRTADVLS